MHLLCRRFLPHALIYPFRIFKLDKSGCNSATLSDQCSEHVRVTDALQANDDGDNEYAHLSPEPGIHTMDISFHLPVPNEPLSRSINCVIPL